MLLNPYSLVQLASYSAAEYLYRFTAGTSQPVANAGTLAAHSLSGSPGVVSAPGGGLCWEGQAWAGATNASFTAYTGSFTMEAWVYLLASGDGDLFGFSNGVLSVRGQSLVMWDYPSEASTTATLALNTWSHIAACRSGATMRIFANGAQVNSHGGSSSGFGDNTAGLLLGAQSGYMGTGASAYLDDIAVTRSAKYTAAFTPPPRGTT